MTGNQDHTPLYVSVATGRTAGDGNWIAVQIGAGLGVECRQSVARGWGMMGVWWGVTHSEEQTLGPYRTTPQMDSHRRTERGVRVLTHLKMSHFIYPRGEGLFHRLQRSKRILFTRYYLTKLNFFSKNPYFRQYEYNQGCYRRKLSLLVIFQL